MYDIHVIPLAVAHLGVLVEQPRDRVGIRRGGAAAGGAVTPRTLPPA